MRNALAIIRIDVAEKQFILWTALALSFAPFVLMLVPVRSRRCLDKDARARVRAPALH